MRKTKTQSPRATSAPSRRNQSGAHQVAQHAEREPKPAAAKPKPAAQEPKPAAAKPKPAAQEPSGSAARRSYGQYCGLAHALDVIGERWTLLILRDLLLGPRRYGTLLEGLRGSDSGGGITTNLLAKRLRDLEATALIERTKLHGVSAYQLTPRGNALEPAIQELARWGGTHFMDSAAPGERMSVGWMLLNLKRKATPCPERLVINVSSLDDEHFTLELGPTGLQVSDQRTSTPDCWLRGDLLSLHRVLFRGEQLVDLEQADLLRFEGKREALSQLLRQLSPRRRSAGRLGAELEG